MLLAVILLAAPMFLLIDEGWVSGIIEMHLRHNMWGLKNGNFSIDSRNIPHKKTSTPKPIFSFNLFKRTLSKNSYRESPVHMNLEWRRQVIRSTYLFFYKNNDHFILTTHIENVILLIFLNKRLTLSYVSWWINLSWEAIQRDQKSWWIQTPSWKVQNQTCRTRRNLPHNGIYEAATTRWRW